VCYDIWFYISHRILHSVRVYPMHSIHHKYANPTVWDTYEGHWFESVFQGVGTFIPLIWHSYSVMEYILILIFLNVRGMMRHDARCVWYIGNHHLLHHQYPRYNYGEYWLDWLCGSLYPNRGEATRGILYM
jgi:sterol desaturase/sphingolipid hydroxylase (fatty acid hydroxylase superfamily)